jgi:hypothetical protein
MDDILYIANNRWIVETHAPMWQDYEKLFDKDHPNLVEPGKSTTVNGYQIPQALEETKPIADFIVEKTNKVLQDGNVPCNIHTHIQSWSIKYYPGGWKGMHNHSKGKTGCTAVLYFDDIKDQPNDEGAFYAVLQDAQGETYVNWWQPQPGKLLIMDARIWHGAYPTLNERRVMVFDFEVTWHE